MKENRPLLVDNTVFPSKPAWSRILRYMLQSEARRLLPFKHRTRVCQRLIASGKDTVDIMLDRKNQSAYYRHLVVCGMPWTCPVCAARITEHRRIEVARAVREIAARVVLVTYTVQHSASERLITVRRALQDAYTFMWSGRWAEEFNDEYGVMGTIKALEDTFGKNGFHPHFHCLMFLDAHDTLKTLEGQFQNELRQRWQYSLEKHGRYAKWDTGLTVKIVYSDIAEYVAKMGHEPMDNADWEISHEVAKGPAKIGRLHGFTPNQLLIESYRGNFVYENIWREHVEGTVHCKQIRWSQGLRTLAGLEEKERGEKEIAELLPDSYELFASFSHTMWAFFLDQKVTGEILQIAGRGDIEALWEFFDKMKFKFEFVDLRSLS